MPAIGSALILTPIAQVGAYKIGSVGRDVPMSTGGISGIARDSTSKGRRSGWGGRPAGGVRL
jgi:hypothetical protein